MKTSARIYLASNSPRRRELLTLAGIEPVVVPSGIEEVAERGSSPKELSKTLARRKALSAAEKLGSRFKGWLVAADTIVFDRHGCIGKPASLRESRRMLRRLSGKTHWVATGYCVISRNKTGRMKVAKEILSGVETTAVKFRQLTEREMRRYVSSRDGMDKAGAYGIQEGAAGFVSFIEGSYTNVVGLPLAQVLKALRKLGARV